MQGREEKEEEKERNKGQQVVFCGGMEIPMQRNWSTGVGALVIVVAVLQSCAGKDSPKKIRFGDELTDLRQRSSVAAPIDSHEELARRVRIDISRAEAIDVGEVGKERLHAELAKPLLKICDQDICVCTGDADCNSVFSRECRDPKTNGACSDSAGVTICFCRPSRALQ